MAVETAEAGALVIFILLVAERANFSEVTAEILIDEGWLVGPAGGEVFWVDLWGVTGIAGVI